MKFVLKAGMVIGLIGAASSAHAKPFFHGHRIGQTHAYAHSHAHFARTDAEEFEPAVVDEAAKSNDVVREASRWIGFGNMTGRGGPWCASFASFVLAKTGRAPLAGNMVSAALSYGPRLAEPKLGAMAVISTRYGYAGHVGFVSGVNPDGSIRLISGNWGRRVAPTNVPRRVVVAFVDVP